MALVHRNSRWRGLTLVVATTALQCMQPCHAATSADEIIHLDASSTKGRLLETMNVVNPKVTQGSTLLTALRGEATSLDGNLENSTLKFTGDVHLEFDGAVLDAQAATAVFVDGQLTSVDFPEVAPQASKKPVHLIFKSAVLDVDLATVLLAEGRIRTILATGKPTQFSYGLKKSGKRVSGRANKIEYDAEKESVRFTGDAWYTDGNNNESTVSALTYNFKNDTTDADDVKAIYRPSEDKVPQLRTPDRATAR